MRRIFCTERRTNKGTFIASTLFKVYLFEALKLWRAKCYYWEFKSEKILYNLDFADDHIICTQDEEDEGQLE